MFLRSSCKCSTRPLYCSRLCTISSILHTAIHSSTSHHTSHMHRNDCMVSTVQVIYIHTISLSTAVRLVLPAILLLHGNKVQVIVLILCVNFLQTSLEFPTKHPLTIQLFHQTFSLNTQSPHMALTRSKHCYYVIYNFVCTHLCNKLRTNYSALYIQIELGSSFVYNNFKDGLSCNKQLSLLLTLQ